MAGWKVSLGAAALAVGTAAYWQFRPSPVEPCPIVPGATKVLVTGAGGRTGSILLRNLLASEKFAPTGMVRSEASKRKLAAKLGHEAAALPLVLGDVTKGGLAQAMRGQECLVVLTSACPKIVYSSLPKVMWAKLTSSKKVSPDFVYPAGGAPEEVDWLGQKAQIDAAVSANVKHVVLVSSMGGTDPDHFLNRMGNGKILLWKRKAEQYLISSGRRFTIIHPGGLLPHFGRRGPVAGGERELVVGVDDVLLKEKEHNSIPREDLAEVCHRCLLEPSAFNRSFDLGSKSPGDGVAWDGSVEALLAPLQDRNCDYSAPDLAPLLSSGT
mmetsp:Transcript_14091/g.15747  ORF Transcript_14091/g.15747 Transcript_14091/m.15747 type:complete len:326 (+) Transcript_14091:55-1032(+)